ncbi:MAG: carbohydrate kinase [Verrucomicrobiota bacterium]
MSFKVVGIGEVLWDVLPDGPQLGGAPANFACHAQALGATARVVTRVGNDSLGHEIVARFRRMGLPDNTVQVDNHAPTGTVLVSLNGNGNPHFEIRENVAWDRLELTGEALQSVRDADAICFGSLAQRHQPASKVIQQLAASAPARCFKVLDINLRQTFYSKNVVEQSLKLVNVLKLNDQELPVIAHMFGLQGSVEKQIEWLARHFGLKVVALTRGAQGSLLYQDGNWSDRLGSCIKVVDTVGAGDSFTAGLVMGLLAGMSLGEIHSVAADIADFVCSHQGATPVLPDKFRKALVPELVKVPVNPTSTSADAQLIA